jgi:diguanylate cyclase (GGDEF)-like protein
MMVMAISLIIGYSLFTYLNEKSEYQELSLQEMHVLSKAFNHDYAELILLGLPSASIEMTRKWRSFPMIEHADLEDSSGRPLLHYSKSNDKHIPAPIENTGARSIIVDGLLFYKHDVVYQQEKIGVVHYVVSNKRYEALLGDLIEYLLVLIPISLGLSILLSLWLQNIFTQPLQNLMGAITGIIKRADYSADIHVDVKDKSEFATLGRDFNLLLKQIDSNLKEVEASNERIQELAYYDELTGLPNRRLLTERMEYILDLSKREQRHGALLFIDLDNFKTLNDSRGHVAGDDLLKQVANRLKKVFRAEDTVARLGGDEFVILSGNLEESEECVANQVHSLMLKLRHVLSERFDVQGEGYHLTSSVGISVFPSMADSAEELMKQADTAMYRTKEAGRDGYRFYAPKMQAVADNRLQVEDGLRNAVLNNELELFYQPQVDEYGRILGAEALLRWFKKDGEAVSPASFIPVAESTGLIVPVGDWVLKQGIKQLKLWLDEGVSSSFRLSINISPFQFHQDDFVNKVTDLIKETGVPASNVTLEVTEGITISDIESTIGKMNVLTDIGFKVSMDDFGTGYSSLTYLKKLPLSELKIDQSFVRDLHVDESDAEIAATIIAMAKSLKLEVVAEGVEEESQLRFLSKNGCEVFQGYYFHKPMRVKDLNKILLGNLVII